MPGTHEASPVAPTEEVEMRCTAQAAKPPLNMIRAFVSLLAIAMALAGCGTGGLDATRPESAANGPISRMVTPSTPADPLAASLPTLSPMGDSPLPAPGLQKVVITLRDAAGKSADSREMYEALKSAEVSVLEKGGNVTGAFPFIGAIAADLSERGVAELRQDPRVAYVEPDLPVQAEASEIDSCWGVARVGGPSVIARGNRGAGVRVAIIDTGVDYTHPDLRDAYAGGYDFFSNDADPMDEHWHGTHVAGIVAARANGTGAVGVAPECRLYALKVCGANGAGSFSAIVAALQWCVNNGIQVANVSLGSTAHPGQYVENAFNAAQSAGVVVVAAAGNSGTTDGSGNTVTYPGAFASCICVAAVDAKNGRVGFSGSGPRVDVAAPGAGIYSCTPNGGYGTFSGTSMASPHVAGVMALALKRGYSPLQARARLLATALDLGAAGRDPLYGNGLVRADLLVEAGNTVPSVSITSPVAGASLPQGKVVTFSARAVDVEDGDLTSRIVWSVDKQIFAQPSVSLRLTDGSHVATATVADRAGVKSSSTVQITLRNQVPVLTVTSPRNGASFRKGAPITFSASAIDAEDGDVSRNIVWNTAGRRLGTGPRVTCSTLPVGTNTVMVQITDSTRTSGAAQAVRVTITP